jgi:hypothetical protein
MPTTAQRGQVPEGHLVSKPRVSPCRTQGQAENEGMVLVAYAGPESPAAALRERFVLCLPTDIHPLLVNNHSSSFQPLSLSLARRRRKHERRRCFISQKNMFCTDARPARSLAASNSPLPKEPLHILISE